MSEQTLSLHGRIGTGLVGLAALASQGFLTPAAMAAPGNHCGWDVKTNKKLITSADMTAMGPNFPGLEVGAYVAAGSVVPPGGGAKHSGVFVGTGAGAANRSQGMQLIPERARLEAIPGSTEFFDTIGSPQGGVRIAAGDIDGDGSLDVIGGAATGPSAAFADRIKIKFPAAFDYAQRDGIYVAAGDVNNDGRAEVIVGPSKGDDSTAPAQSPVVKSFSLNSAGDAMVPGTSITPFAGTAYTGGVRVAAGDVDGDGFAEVVVGADQGTNPTLRFFTKWIKWNDVIVDSHGSGEGVYFAVGDVNGDGLGDLVTAPGPGGAPVVDIYTYNPDLGGTGVGGFALAYSFADYTPDYLGGVSVAIGDFDGNGTNDIITTQIAAVPEPASAALLMLAGGGMLGRRRRSRRGAGSCAENAGAAPHADVG